MIENHTTLKKELALVQVYLQSHTMIVLKTNNTGNILWSHCTFTNIQQREKEVIFYDHQHLLSSTNSISHYNGNGNGK